MRLKLVTVSVAALMVATGCEGDRAAATGQVGSVEVDPSDVSAADLKQAVSDERVRRFYEARGWQPVWAEEQADDLTAALGEAGRHGLSAESFQRQLADAATPAAREAALTYVALSYADALANGQADPKKIREIYTVPMPNHDLVQGLAQAAEQGTVGQWLRELAPQDAEYRALSDAFVEYTKRAAAQGDAQDIGAGESIHEGDADPRVPRIVEALRSNGYLGELPPERNPNLYTAAVAQAVARLQEDYGLKSDGIVGTNTLEVLNTGAAERARMLAINLERRRWLERNPPQTRIDVNTAAAMLDYWHDGAHADRRRVVVGQPGWETPQLGSPIFRLVANPSWTVPKSIEEEEIAPKGPGYLRANNMVRRDGWIVQLPGPDTALGLVKFDMKNDHAIYLHDTPAKALFERNQRHASHGCVRVHNAVEFARLLAEHNGISSEFEEALASGEETFIAMNRQIPVRLLYHTAYVDRAGKLQFRPDPYGWDEDLAEALGMESRERRTLQTHINVEGP